MDFRVCGVRCGETVCIAAAYASAKIQMQTQSKELNTVILCEFYCI